MSKVSFHISDDFGLHSSSWLRVGAVDAHLDARTLNAEITNILNRKVTSITQDPDLRKYIGEEYINEVTPFVPMKTGKLRGSAVATTDGRVIWSAIRITPGSIHNYAPTQYETKYSNYTTPGTGPYWTENVQPGTAEWLSLIQTITPVIVERFKDG